MSLCVLCVLSVCILSVRVTIAEIKQHDQMHVGEERVDLAFMSTSWPIIESLSLIKAREGSLTWWGPGCTRADAGTIEGCCLLDYSSPLVQLTFIYNSVPSAM